MVQRSQQAAFKHFDVGSQMRQFASAHVPQDVRHSVAIALHRELSLEWLVMHPGEGEGLGDPITPGDHDAGGFSLSDKKCTSQGDTSHASRRTPDSQRPQCLSEHLKVP